MQQATRDGSFVPAVLPPDAFAGTIQHDSTTWNAELRIGLDWLGGYGHNCRIQLTLEGVPGGQNIWPAGSRVSDSTSWGLLTFQPVYSAETVAGSMFFDGASGHLAVPHSPALNPRAMTIAAWVRVFNNDCGTIVGNGRSKSYWVGVCGVLRFSSSGGFPLEGRQSLGSSWHHVAVTINADGTRALYVDGVLDRAVDRQPPPVGIDGKPRDEATEPLFRLSAGNLPLWIGADRDVSGEESFLHGNLQDLAIWNRPLSAEEVRQVATSHPSSEQRGLVAYWPLMHGGQDVVGGQDAGFVGDPSLARDAPVRRLSPLLKPPKGQLVRPKPRVAWNARIPFLARDVQIDGTCKASEWQGAAKVRLEPGRLSGMRLLGTPDALYLCTEPLFGKGKNSAILWIARDGATRVRPGPNDLRFTLSADGTLATAVGDGTRFVARELPGVRAATISGEVWGWQDDEDRVQAPWWSSELRIPLSTLTPFSTGRRLRFGIRYEGSLAKEAASRLRPGSRFLPVRPAPPHSSKVLRYWPAGRPDDRPSSWGAVTSQSLRASSGNPTRRGPVDHTSPVPDPTTSDFYNACPYDNLDPGQWGYVSDFDTKWPLVSSDNVIVRSEGTLHDDSSGVKVSGEDSPQLHDSHDVDLMLHPSTAAAQALTLNASGSQKLEVETAQLPPTQTFNVQARPDRGDHVTAVGRWVFDCGHSPRTELHPLYKLESDRTIYRTLPNGKISAFKLARVFFNSRPTPNWDYWREGLAPLDFFMGGAKPADGYGMPFLRVLTGDPGRVSISPSATNDVRVTPPPLSGSNQAYFTRILTGLAVPPASVVATSTYKARSLTLHLDSIKVKNDHDDNSEGEWFLWANASGFWVTLFSDKDVDDEEEDPYPLGVTMNVISDNPELQITGFEEDGLLDEGGQDLEPLIIPLDVGMQGPAETSDYILYYHVDQGPGYPAALKDNEFWAERVKDEPYIIDLGRPLHVPIGGQTLTHNGYITEKGAAYDGGETRLLASDLDSYGFIADDFVDISFGTLPASLQPLAFGTNAYRSFPDSSSALYEDSFYYSGMSACERAALGSRGATLTVRSKSGSAGDVPYTLNMTVKRRALLPDWGEPLEQGTSNVACYATPQPGKIPGFRSVDLTTDADKSIEERFAWQHFAGDIDYYNVKFPPGKQPPARHEPSSCDNYPTVIVKAPRMKLKVGGQEALNELTFSHVDQKFPDRRILVEVRHPQNGRDAYRFKAEWFDGRYRDQAICNALEAAKQLEHKKFLAIRPVPPEDIVTQPGVDPIDINVNIYGNVGYRELRMQSSRLDMALSTRPGITVTAQIYDSEGVMLAESEALNQEVVGRIPSGLVTQRRLRVERLQPGATYLLVLKFSGTIGTSSEVQLGLRSPGT